MDGSVLRKWNFIRKAEAHCSGLVLRTILVGKFLHAPCCGAGHCPKMEVEHYSTAHLVLIFRSDVQVNGQENCKENRSTISVLRCSVSLLTVPVGSHFMEHAGDS